MQSVKKKQRERERERDNLIDPHPSVYPQKNLFHPFLPSSLILLNTEFSECTFESAFSVFYFLIRVSRK